MSEKNPRKMLKKDLIVAYENLSKRNEFLEEEYKWANRIERESRQAAINSAILIGVVASALVLVGALIG